MPENKTKPTHIDPAAVISALDEGHRKRDAETLDAMMRRLSGAEPVMWGAAMFGYGSYEYTYSSGRKGTFFRAGFALRSRQIVVYVIPGLKVQKTNWPSLVLTRPANRVSISSGLMTLIWTCLSA